MNQIRSTDYLIRHLRTVLPHITLQKLANTGLNLLERERKFPTPRSSPLFVKIEPTNLCQLRCPGCKQSQDALGRRSRGENQMSLEQFRTILAPLAPNLMGISFSLSGEPLMHPGATDLIAEAHRQRVAVTFPSNLSLRMSEDAAERLVLSGVDAIFVSLDGASAETYSHYRVGGNFELVLTNVAAIAAARRRLGLKRPRLIWKFVVFDHNRHEMDRVRHGYSELGFDGFEFVPDRRNPQLHAKRRDYRLRLARSGKGCYWLWHCMIIQWDGEVRPCCATPEGFGLGNAIADGTLTVWRSVAYEAMRRGFADPTNMVDACKICLGVAPVEESSSLCPTASRARP